MFKDGVSKETIKNNPSDLQEELDFNKDIECKKEKDFLYSFDLSPADRLELRKYIKYLNYTEEDKASLRPNLYAINDYAEKFPPEVIKSDYVKNLVVKQVERMLKTGDGLSGYKGILLDFKKYYDIDDAFFKSDLFNNFKQSNWLHRIEYGELINDKDRINRDDYGYIKEDREKNLSREKSIEEINFGDFKSSGIKADLPEIKAKALKGLVHNVFWFRGNNDYERDVLGDYKKIFNITEEEFEQSVINQLVREKISNQEDCDKLRKHYKFIDDFLSSDKAKIAAVNKFEDSYINNEGYKDERLLNYFSLKENQFDFKELREKRRLREKEYLIDRIKDKSADEYIFYSIERSQDILKPEDWLDIINNYGQTENFINGIAYSLSFDFKVDDTFGVLKKIGVPDNIIKKVVEVAVEFLLRDKNGVNYDNLNNLKIKAGFTEAEFKQALVKGVIELLGYNYHKYVIERILKNFNIEKFNDNNSETQERLKKLYLSKIELADLDDLEHMDSKFSLDWLPEDKSARALAVKKALCNESRLRSFKEAKDIKKFIDDYYPETHKFFITADKEVCTAIEKMLVDLVLSSNDYENKPDNYFEEVIKIFGLSRDKVINSITKIIEEGNYINYADGYNNINKFVSNFNLIGENKICLDNHSEKIIEQAFESKNWAKLRDIKRSGHQQSIEIINSNLDKYKEILKDTARSINLRIYAIETLIEISGQLRPDIENEYFVNLVDVYSSSDVNKLYRLFKEKSSLFEGLSLEFREKAFDSLLDKDKYSKDININIDEVKQKILESKIVVFLNNGQLDKAVDTRGYNKLVTGLRQADNSGLLVPSDLYDFLYGKLTDQEEKDVLVKTPVEFINNLKSIWDGYRNNQILKTVANNPEKINVIKDIINLIDKDILMDNWLWIYDSLKECSVQELEIRTGIINKLKSHIKYFGNSYSIQELYEILIDYSPEKCEQVLQIPGLEGQQKVDFQDNEWPAGLYSYIDVAEQENKLNLTSENKTRILNLFNSDYKDAAFGSMHKEWIEFLKGDNKIVPLNLLAVTNFIDQMGGAGTLKYVESLGNLVYQFNVVSRSKSTASRTIKEIKELLTNQENRMNRERWPQDDKAEFYNLSHDIIEAAPSLYTTFESLFAELSAKEMKIVLTELLPLYQAQLIILQKIDDEGEPSYQAKDLVGVRLTIRELVNNLKNSPKEKADCLSAEKVRLVEVVKNSFKERFGIINVPENFTKEHIRSVHNCVRYIGNINNRNETKEALVALFLGLELNSKWSDFRENKAIILEEYLSDKQIKLVKPILENKTKIASLSLEVAGISLDKAEEFQQLLQEEVMSSIVGSIETVDIKLGNIKRNIDELADPDIYPDKLDKEIMRILQIEGRQVGAVLAKVYGSLDGKDITLDDKEKALQARLAEILGIGGWTKEKIKQTQDKLQPFSLVSNMISKMQEEGVERNINELGERLTPSQKIIEIFNRLGESFTQTSGALALGKDIIYLENLVVKDENKISLEEKKEVNNYLSSIKEKMKDLEITLDKVKEYFIKIKKSSHLENHELLKKRLADIEKIVFSESTNTMVVSHLTKDLNLIIENMRQCLGCLRKEINNDTNLAFGDSNKFFIINQTEKDKGSISDEIVFFVPTKDTAGNQEMSFVMDRVYGSKSPDILISNIISIVKKYKSIKKEIPEAKISVSVSQEAMSSVGLDAALLNKRLQSVLPDIKVSESVQDLVADIPKSSFSDNYVEFGNGSSREHGERKFSGSIIR
ncbi:hypothetical protein KKC17_04215 [Patescibacteria group bacterium]|nr:hypothetical protein [Patescibacteria group bacterium]